MSDSEKEPVAEPIFQQSIPDSNQKDDKISEENSDGPTDPSGTSTDPSGISADPSGTSTDPSGASTDPSGPSTDPSDLLKEPSGASTEYSVTTTEPSGGVTEPSGGVTEPSGGVTEPSGGVTEPSGGVTEPSGGVTEPSDSITEHSAVHHSPNEIASPDKVPRRKEFDNDLDFEDEAHSVVEKSKGASENEEEETKDDGECSDGGDDLEEGELHEDATHEDSGNSKSNLGTKQMCRFYSRGQCFFGANCRFAHVNSISGNNSYYNMFGPSTPVVPRVPYSDYFDSTSHGMMSHRSGPLPPRSTGSDFLPPPQACSQPPHTEESAWERGLQTAKDLLKKANKRKLEDADCSEGKKKDLNLGLIVNEKNVPEFFEKNDTPSYKKKRKDVQYIFPKYDEAHEAYDNYEARTHYREGFDHFDVRYHREQQQTMPRGGDRRERMDREPRDKFRPKSPRSKDRYKDDRLQEVESRSRNPHTQPYFDPWRRSKSPKGNARRSRSRSGSYSSVSSYSWSDRSFSSNSFSRSSRSSSRSPPPHQKRKPSPTITNPPFISDKPGPPPTNTFTTMKKKPEGRGGVSSSRSRTPSISRSRSFSRSISMSSVSSASSRDSLSNSSGSASRRQNSTSILRKQEENPPLPVGKPVDPPKVPAPPPPPPIAIPLSSMYLNYPLREKEVIQEIIESPIIEELERDPLEEKFLAPDEPLPFPSLQHLLPTSDRAKEPSKAPPHKQQIKLTLLNKNPQNKINNLPKKELDVNRKPIDESSKSANFYFGIKGPLSPPPVIAKPTPVLVPKKSASSRRDELLKQLKAVEDAIARKRAKFG